MCKGSNLGELSDVTWIRFLCLLRSAMILQLSSSDVRDAAQAHGTWNIARLSDQTNFMDGFHS